MEPLYGEPNRPCWEVHALYEHTVPEALRAQYEPDGPTLGCASFYTTKKITHKESGAEHVVRMIDPHALERSEDGFAIKERLIRELARGDYKVSVQIPTALEDITRSARISAALETLGQVGVAQAMAMQERYEGLVVSTDSKSIPQKYHSAVWYHYGPEFSIMECMPGEVFNKLPIKSPKQKQVKHDIALADVTVELFMIFSGLDDPDRHGRNKRNKVTRDAILNGQFDHGAVHAVVHHADGRVAVAAEMKEALANGGTVEIPVPNSLQKQLMAKAMVKTISQFIQGEPLTNALHSEVTRLREEGHDTAHLVRVERALLKLQDSIRCLDMEKDPARILTGLLYSSDTRIQEGLREFRQYLDAELVTQLGPQGPLAVETYLRMVENPVSITITAQNYTPPMPIWHDMPLNRRLSSLVTPEDLIQFTPPTAPSTAPASPDSTVQKDGTTTAAQYAMLRQLPARQRGAEIQ